MVSNVHVLCVLIFAMSTCITGNSINIHFESQDTSSVIIMNLFNKL